MAELQQGVTIDFTPVLQIRPEDLDLVFRIVFLDTTRNVNQGPFTINTLQFRLTGGELTTPYIGDALVYINTERRDREWYAIESDMLGLGEGQPIPDGIYTASLEVNNSTTTEHSFVLYRATELAINKLLDDAGFSVNTNQFNLQYQHSDKYDFENLSLLYSLLAELKQNSLDGNSVAAQEALTKAQRILKILV